jgi:hypothetical protein
VRSLLRRESCASQSSRGSAARVGVVTSDADRRRGRRLPRRAIGVLSLNENGHSVHGLEERLEPRVEVCVSRRSAVATNVRYLRSASSSLECSLCAFEPRSFVGSQQPEGVAVHCFAALHCFNTAVSKQFGSPGRQIVQVAPHTLPAHGS